MSVQISCPGVPPPDKASGGETAGRDAAAAALGDECSNIRGAVQKTEAPQKPRKEDDDRSKIHHYIYIYVCLFVCLCVCVYVSHAPAERASNIRGAVQKSETPRPPKRAMTVQKSAPLLRSFGV